MTDIFEIKRATVEDTPLILSFVMEWEKWAGLAVNGAFVIGPDGHNIEAVCHDPE